MFRAADTPPKSDDKVDILMATYNGAGYLREQLDSIADQTHRNWRLVVRDDGSTDKTKDILAAFAAAHPGKVKIIDDGKRKLGSGQNFAALMQEAANDRAVKYIMFSDQDDIWF